MRVPLIVALALAGLYGGYWFVGERQVETRAAAALDGLRAQGWEVEYGSLDTTGFPSRFDTTVTDLRLAPPGGAVEWSAPFLQVLALSYRPNQVIAAFPPEQVVTVAGQPVTVTSEGLRASALAGLSRDLPLRDARVESGALTVAGPGLGVGLDRMVGGLRLAPEAAGATDRPAGGARYDLFLDAFGLGVRGSSLGVDEVRLQAVATLDRPLDRRLQGAPRLLGLAIEDARVVRGASSVAGEGQLAVDADGFLAGTVTVTAENWREMLALLTDAGALGAGPARLAQAGLERLSGGGDRIEVPVTFAEGRVSALGIPLLAAPRVAPAGG